MSPSLSRPLARGLVAFASIAAALAASGCGDGIICQLEAIVIIRSPQGPLVADSDPRTDGLQTDVMVASTLPREALLTLSVRDADGAEIATATQRADRDGNAVFADVTIPAGGATLRVSGEAGSCGGDDDEVVVTLVGGGDCGVAFATEPVDLAHYAPVPVFNISTDSNPAVADHQGDVVVTARPGEQVRLLVSAPGLPETEVAAGTTGAAGTITLATSLPQGQVSLRASCGDADLGARSSSVTSVFVDTQAPACALIAPTPGTSITPALDTDPGAAGIQLTATARADGDDTDGEAATFTLTAPGGATTVLVGTEVADGESSAAVSFDPAASPAAYSLRFATQDHATNRCAIDQPYRVVLGGCAITVVVPTTTVTVDADPATPGAQVDLIADVAEACVGRTVTSDCGLDDPSAVVIVGGSADLRATVCTSLPCESSELCTLRVTSPDGIETTAGVDLRYDDLAPNVSVAVAQPSGVACGTTVTPDQDIDGVTPGVQLRLRVTAPAAATRSLRLTNAGGTTTTPIAAPSGELVATLAAGSNSFVGLATDAAGNPGTSAPCAIGLSDLAVTFTGSAADGTVGPGDGTAAAGGLTFALTGTVSTTGATVAVTVDGGPALAAIVTGTTWSRTLTLADQAGPYAVVATATRAAQTGTAALALTVDLTAPAAPSALTARVETRASIRLGFTTPAGASSYRLKFATTALTDANFDSTGTAVAAPTPGAAGSPAVARVTTLRAGTPYWVGVAAVDAGGNRSPAVIAGPLTPRFDQAAVVPAPNPSSTAAFGLAMAHGRFNDDDFDDVAVGAPLVTAAGLASAGEVYVYLGSATGLGATPALTIQGGATNATLGSSLAALRRPGGSRHDLAIGAPGADGDSGAIYVFDGGPGLPTGTVVATSAGRRIGVATAANWFSGSALGWQLAAADHDGDGTDDLIASAVFGQGGATGAVVVFYGGTIPTGNVRISDLSAAGSGGAVIRMYEDPDAGALFGFYLHAVGPTTGAADLTDDLVVGYAEDTLPGGTVVVYRGLGRPAAPGVTRAAFTPGRDVRLRYVTNDVQLEWGSAVGSISDQNGDGARELILADFRDSGDNGVAFIIDGDTLGSGGVASLDSPGVVLTTMRQPVNGLQFGMAVVNNARTPQPDIDGNGREDLVIAALDLGTRLAVLDVWFGPIPPGVQVPPAPDHVLTGPASFRGLRPTNGGTPITAIWAGDVNADGLDDVCWADWTSNTGDGALQLVWDDGL